VQRLRISGGEGMTSQVSETATGGIPRQAAWPARSGPVPPLADSFSLRPETGLGGTAELAAGSTVVLTNPAEAEDYPLATMGGTGKTQLAAGLAHSLWRSGAIDLLLWVTASSREAVLTGYADAMERIGLATPFASPPDGGVMASGTAAPAAPGAVTPAASVVADPAASGLAAAPVARAREGLAAVHALADPTAPDGAAARGDAIEAAAERFVSWLADTERRWLVVLDDVASTADLEGLWPRGSLGQTLVTTRLPPATMFAPDREIIEVRPFSRREALSYLTARLDEDAGQRIGAFDLAEDLSRLPLALAQAAALIADCEIGCREYRAMYADRKRHVGATDADGYAAGAAVTWSLSLDRANELAPAGLARRALALIALLDPAGIPGAVLSSRSAVEYISGRAEGGEQMTVGALDNLARLGLVAIDPGSATRTVRMHGLVQAAAQRFLRPAALEPAAKAAADALVQAWPEPDRDPLLAQALRDCTASLRRPAAQLLWVPAAHPVLFRAGESLDDAGLTGQAIAYWQAITDTSGSILGSGHAQTFRARDSLAAAFEAAGRTDDAIGAYQPGLAERERALGSGHPDTLVALSKLAHAHLTAHRLAEAVPLYERAVASREWVLGPYHPDTLTARGDLAAAYLTAGRLPDAIGLYQQTLADCERSLAPGDPLTRRIRAELQAVTGT
jgi:tetratricopeptide (TPR) repeat protein